MSASSTPSASCSSLLSASSGFKGEIRMVTSYWGCCVRKIYFTLKSAELLLAMKAAPKHMASSPLRCTLISFLS